MVYVLIYYLHLCIVEIKLTLLLLLFSAVGSLLMYPATKLVGPGWTYTILSGFLMLSNIIIPTLMKYGTGWRTQRILKEEEKKRQQKY